MKKLILVSLLISLATVIESAQANHGHGGGGGGISQPSSRKVRIVLPMYNAHYRGRGSVIPLKRLIKDQNPQINLRNMKLKKVKLIAKSKRGHGSAELLVGHSTQDRKTIGGSPRDFQNNQGWTYDRLDLKSYTNLGGKWQILLNGNIKVKKVVVVMEKAFGGPGGPGGPGRLQYINIGKKKFDKFVDDYNNYSVNQYGVYQIKITGNKQAVNIKSAVATLRNGRQISLYRLVGTLYDGETKVAYLNGEYISSVQLVGTSTQAFGSRGKVNLTVGVR